MKSKSTLLLLTQKFPFESGEEFLVPELRRLSDEFDRIILVPTAVRDFSVQRITQEKISVYPIRNPESPKDVVFALIKGLPKFLPLVLEQLKNTLWNFKLIKYWVYHIPFALRIRDELEILWKKEEHLVFYSYWVDTNAYALSLLKLKYPQVKYVARTHGGDLYDERSPTGEIAFRRSVYEGAEAIWPISAHGVAYIVRNFPEFEDKLKLARLGVDDFGIGPILANDHTYQLVSCSSVIPLKRVELIAELMLKSELPIRWIHFGGEKDAFDRILKIVGKGRSGLEVIWKGKVTNKALMDFYGGHFVDTLINLSTSEGLPVSMMEAISFGIPIFASQVGGVGEIVVETTGCLVEEGQNIKDLTEQFDGWIKSGRTRDKDFRLGVRRFWESNFNAEVNHEGFLQRMNGSPEKVKS